MKRLVFLLLAAVLVLIACNAEEPKEKSDEVAQDQPRQETTSENSMKEDKEDEAASSEDPIENKEQEEASEPMNDEKLVEIIEYEGMGEEDTLVSASLGDGEIKAVIELAPSELLSAEDLAVTRYSQASDGLLEHEGWDVLTIEYVDVGTISMNRSEKETNEYDMDYFPVAEIEKRLK